MSFAKEGIEWMASVFRQAIPQLQDQGDTLRHHYYLLSDQMNTLAQGTTGWEGQASAFCQQLWEDLGPNLMLQIEALDNLCDALSILADQFDVIHANPSQAAADMGLPVAGLSLSVGGDAAGDAGSALLGGLAIPIAIVAFVVVAGVVVYVTEQEEEQNAITATQQVVSVALTETPARNVADATATIPAVDAPGAAGGQGDPGQNSPKWPYFVVDLMAVGLGVAGVTALIEALLTPSQQQQAHDIAAKYHFNLQDVERLLDAGFTEAQIVALLQAGYTMSDIAILLSAGCTPTQVASYAAAGIPVSAIAIVCQRIQQAQASPTGVDQYGVPASAWPGILDRLATLFSYSRNIKDKESAAGYQFEGDTVQNLLNILVKAGEEFPPPNATDIDVETPCAIIEVTLQKDGKTPQIRKLQSIAVNPLQKQVVLFAPNYNPVNAQRLTTNLGVPVIRTQADLDTYLSHLKCGNPGGN